MHQTMLSLASFHKNTLALVLQKKTQFILHPVTFMSEKMSPAECNYGIGDKELLAIVVALEKWHIYLHQLPHTFTIMTDHYNLQTFSTKALLSRHQARWAQELVQYDFKIVSRPGTQNGKAHMLTRRSGDLPEEGDGWATPTQPLIPTLSPLSQTWPRHPRTSNNRHASPRSVPVPKKRY